MKTKNKLVVFFFFLILTACNQKKETPDYYRELLEQLQSEMVDKHLNHNLVQLQLQSRTIPADLRLHTPKNDGLVLADLIESSSPLLVFRYSEIHCNSCTDLVIQKMNEWYEAGLRQMAIIASYDEFRHFTSFARANRLKMPIYLLDQETATGIFDTDIPPYLFLVDTSLQIQFPFVPIKEMEEGIDMYLDFVQDKLNERQPAITRVEAN